ncbi:MAG TPA: hypothetical protein VKR52_21855 [Terracidiphilus sp.]|nr:hypothetical protein [Terracidiphilus sp.]
MRVGINLATRPFADLGPALKRIRIAMGVLAVAAIALGFSLHLIHESADKARARAHSLDGQIAALNHERQSYMAMMREPDNALVLAQSESLNKLFDDKAFSWTLAMEDLETVLPGGVQVTSIEPVRDKEGRISLHLRVLGARDKAIELVSNLEHSRRFVHPQIANESAETNTGPGQQLEPVSASSRVNFDLTAEYNPAGPEDLKAQKAKAVANEHAQHHGASNGDQFRLRPGEHRMPYVGAPKPSTPQRGGGPQ